MSMPKTIHSSVTESRVLELARDALTDLHHPGICLACGEDHDECEPDAREHQCYSCHQRAVYGAEAILLMRAFHQD